MKSKLSVFLATVLALSTAFIAQDVAHDVNSLKVTVEGLARDLPKIIGKTMREVLGRRGGKTP